MMRVNTERYRARTANDRMQRLSMSADKAMNEVISGQRVARPSDDPSAWSASARLGSEASRQRAYAESGHAMESYFSHADGLLGQASDALARAREMIVEFGGNETLNASHMKAAAQEVAALRDAVAEVANARHNDEPLFGGAQGTHPAFAPDGSYAGGLSGRTVSVGDRAQVETLSGEDVFGHSGPSGTILAELDGLIQDLEAGDHDAVRGRAAIVDESLARLGRSRQKIGAELTTIDHARSFSEQVVALSEERAGELTEADFADAVTRLHQSRTSMEASIEVASQIKDISSLILKL